MENKKQKNFLKKIPKEILAVLLVIGIGLYLNYVNASIHVWGSILGIWILITLVEVANLKKQLKK